MALLLKAPNYVVYRKNIPGFLIYLVVWILVGVGIGVLRLHLDPDGNYFIYRVIFYALAWFFVLVSLSIMMREALIREYKKY